MIVLLKQIWHKEASEEIAAIIGVYGNVPLQVGEEVRQTGSQEFLFPECGDSNEQIWSVYHQNYSSGYSTFFRVFVIHIDPAKNKVTVNIAFSRTEPLS